MSHLLVEVPVTTTDADLVSARLWAAGAVGIEQRPDALVVAFADRTVAEEIAAVHGTTCSEVADDTGLDAWRDHATGWTCGPFVIHPPWIDPPGPGRSIVIDPGHAFGSGSHPSTRLALSALTDLLTRVAGERPSVVDIGCGAGVLAVGAALLDAPVVAVDTDPEAVRATRANADRDQCGSLVDVRLGSAEVAGSADIAVVNLTIDLHERAAAAVLRHVQPTTIIASGLLVGDQETRAVAAYRGRMVDRVADGDWVTVVVQTRRP